MHPLQQNIFYVSPSILLRNLIMSNQQTLHNKPSCSYEKLKTTQKMSAETFHDVQTDIEQVLEHLAQKFYKHYDEMDYDKMYIAKTVGPDLGRMIDHLMEENKKLKEEVEELKDFTHWENHPALKHKVVLDDDYYLEHVEDGELIDPETFSLLKEEIKKLKLERQRDTIDEARSARDKALSQVKELKTEVSDILKFIAGDFTYEEAVKDVIKRDYTKEFIDNNEERWEEVGIEWFEDQ